MVKCGDCLYQVFILYFEGIIEKYFCGGDVCLSDFVVGVYLLLQDEICWFFVVDFDKESWVDDIRVLLVICCVKGIFVFFEWLRLGNGGYVWIFFLEFVFVKIV